MLYAIYKIGFDKTKFSRTNEIDMFIALAGI